MRIIDIVNGIIAYGIIAYVIIANGIQTGHTMRLFCTDDYQQNVTYVTVLHTKQLREGRQSAEAVRCSLRRTANSYSPVAGNGPKSECLAFILAA